MDCEDFPLIRRCFTSVGSTFRGEIWEFAAKIPLGKGYANNGKPLDISEACYLKPVFRAIKDPAIREIIIRAAVQSLKTLVTELSAAYLAVHEPGDMTVYDCDLDAAKDHAKSRIGPMIRSVPEIAALIAETASRHDVTTTELYLPGMTLRFWPLNLSATQRKTLKYVIISDAFLSKATGLIGEAKGRFTQQKDYKFICESQGGEDGDDFNAEFTATDQRLLHVICPACAMAQPFHFRKKREDGTWAGFNRGPDELVKLKNGGYNAAAVRQYTHYECYFCRQPWQDTPRIRAQLDESSHYIASHPGADCEKAGFWWPIWINRRIPWGGKYVMMGYLNAKHHQRQHGSVDPLKQWYQKRAGLSWNDLLADESRSEILTAEYDPAAEWKEERWRVLLVDCQLELSYFWYSVHGIARGGITRQLARGSCKTFADLVEIQATWKVPDQRVFLDAGHEQEKLIGECSRHGHVSRKTGRWTCWQLFKGSGLRDFDHTRKDRGRVVERYRSPISSPRIYYVRRGNVAVAVNLTLFSNLLVSDMARRYRDFDHAPECLILPRQPGEPEEEDPLSWSSQLYSEVKTTLRNPKSNLMEERWVLRKQGLANHGWDLLKMLCAFLLKTGLAQNPIDLAETDDADRLLRGPHDQGTGSPPEDHSGPPEQRHHS